MVRGVIWSLVALSCTTKVTSQSNMAILNLFSQHLVIQIKIFFKLLLNYLFQ